MGRAATYEDYLWTERGGTVGEFQSFCLALVEDAKVGDVIAQLPVIEDLGSMGFRELQFRSYDDWDPARMLVGLLQIDSWTVMFEVNGFVGVTPEIIMPMSRGRRIVSLHYSDGNNSQSFKLYVDARLTANFGPIGGVADLQATDPDTLSTMTSLMRESRFDQAPQDHPLEGRQHNRAAAFALMERLTGVQLEPHTIAGAMFYAAVRVSVQVP